MDMADSWRVASEGDSASADASAAASDRLNSWKEIARYLEREVRTVQLWEKLEGLPVHRHFHTRQGRIFAFRSEIEDWRKSRIVLHQSYSAGSAERQIKIMALSSEMPVCPLSDLITDTVEMLDLAGFEVATDFESQLVTYFLRFRPDFEANCLAIDVISTESKEVVWSRSLSGGMSPSGLARSIALLSRCTVVDSIWDNERLADMPTTADRLVSLGQDRVMPEAIEKVNAPSLSEHCEKRTWACLSRGACDHCLCHLW
jgi:hypothetical protein